MISAVIFDFDGVLANTERLHLAAFRQLFAPKGWRLTEADYLDRYLGYNDHDLLRHFVRDHALPVGDRELAALAEAKRHLYEASLDSHELLFPGAKACVDALRRHYLLAVASGSLHAEIVAILTTGGLIDAFSVIVGADDVAASKPAPDSYLAAATGLNVDPTACLAIEDSHWGIDSARAAGMGTIGLTTSSPAATLARADLVLGDIREVSLDVVARFARRTPV